MDGRLFYIVMEFIDGQTLAEHLAEGGRIDPPQFYAFFQQFAEALGWIHQRNIVHRDVKPSNVMFTRAGVLKVTDFGIARELGGVSSTTRIGTPGYASPEQILGQKLTLRVGHLFRRGHVFRTAYGHSSAGQEKPGGTDAPRRRHRWRRPGRTFLRCCAR